MRKHFLAILAIVPVLLFGVFVGSVSAHPDTFIDFDAYCDETNGHVYGVVEIDSNEAPSNWLELPKVYYRFTVGGVAQDGYIPQGGGIDSKTFDLGLGPVPATGVDVFLQYTNTHNVPGMNTEDYRTGTIPATAGCVATTTVPSTTTTSTTSTTMPATTTTVATGIDTPETTIRVTTTTIPSTTTTVPNYTELAATGNRSVWPFAIIGGGFLAIGVNIMLMLRMGRKNN